MLSSGQVTRGSLAHRRRTLTQLYIDHADEVWRWLGTLGVREADQPDVLHDTFVAAFESLASFEGRSTPRTWLFSIASHVASHRRERAYMRREVQQDPPEDACHGAGPEDAASVRQAAEILELILAELPEEQRVAFRLFEIGGMTGAEIAELTDAPLATVFSRLRAARAHVERASGRYLDNGGSGP